MTAVKPDSGLEWLTSEIPGSCPSSNTGPRDAGGRPRRQMGAATAQGRAQSRGRWELASLVFVRLLLLCLVAETGVGANANAPRTMIFDRAMSPERWGRTHMTPEEVPTITSQPTAQTTILGGTAVFTVMASGTPPLSYQWRRNGVSLSDGGNTSGVTSDALILTNCDFADAGDFSVVVSDSAGSTTSIEAALLVNPSRGGDVDFSFTPGSSVNAACAYRVDSEPYNIL